MGFNIGNLWGPVGGALFSALGVGKKKGGGPQGGTVPKKFPGGTANYYDDSYLPLLEGMGQGVGGTAGGLRDLLANFKGDQKNLQDFLQMAAPFLAAQMGNTKAFRDVQRYEDYNKPMQTFGTASGMIGEGARQGMTTAGQSLARSGMGRSGALAGLSGQMAASARQNQSNLFTQLFQQGLQNKQMFANNALDAHRMLSSLSLGHNPAPRQKNPEPDYLGPAIGGASQALGMLPFLL